MNHPGTQALFKVYRISDIAIDDPVGPGALKYSTTRDPSHLSFVDGSKPETFWCRVLTRSEIRECRRATAAECYEAAFCRGLVKVEGLRNEHGEQRDWERPDDRSGKSKPIPDSTLERHFDEATIQEIGMVVYQRSFLARTTGDYYPLPGICRDALAASIHHRAVVMSASSSSAETKPAPEAPPATAPTSSPAGGGSIVVTAME